MGIQDDYGSDDDYDPDWEPDEAEELAEELLVNLGAEEDETDYSVIEDISERLFRRYDSRDSALDEISAYIYGMDESDLLNPEHPDHGKIDGAAYKAARKAFFRQVEDIIEELYSVKTTDEEKAVVKRLFGSFTRYEGIKKEIYAQAEKEIGDRSIYIKSHRQKSRIEDGKELLIGLGIPLSVIDAAIENEKRENENPAGPEHDYLRMFVDFAFDDFFGEGEDDEDESGENVLGENVAAMLRQRGKHLKFYELLERQKKLSWLINSGMAENNMYVDVIYAGSGTESKAITDGLNRQTMRDLKGIDRDMFFSGIGEKIFSMSRAVYDKHTLHERAKTELLYATAGLLPVFHRPDRFFEKVEGTLGIKIPKGATAEQLIEAVGSADRLHRYGALLNEYASRSQNLTDEKDTREIAEDMRFHARKALSIMKIEKGEEGEALFSIRHSAKDPLADISLGIESGCCLYPHRIYSHLLDYATQFAEIYRAEKRKGMAMMFAAKGRENYLAVNSIELSESLAGLDEESVHSILLNTMKYISEYASKSGFSGVLVGNRSYSIIPKYLGRLLKGPPETMIYKIGPTVFSDITGDKGRLENVKMLKPGIRWPASSSI